jgi:glycosyltransferase involved in cell wall biosynthesis
MRNDPFFTIVTASFNNQDTIKQTIESIKNQTFKNLEHIVIDGGSEDETSNILHRARGTYPLAWISEPDNGIADAMNKGLARAGGRYIICIQADDYLLQPDTLERVHPILESDEIDICSFPVILDHPNWGYTLRKPISLLWWNHFKFIFLHQGAFVSKRVFEKIGGYREDYKIAMDYDFFYRALQHRFCIHYGTFPVAVMGGEGIGTSLETMNLRLGEERRVQLLNEQNPIWRLAQFIFSSLYRPYKILSLQFAEKSDTNNTNASK